MKNKIKQLQEVFSGDIKTDVATRNYFSTDGSIFSLQPKIVLYPNRELDVIEAVRFFENIAKKGSIVGLTSRGKGTDQGGAALSEGAVMVFPAHMKKIIEIDKDTITLQPGALYSTVQTVLHSHGRFLPPYPASIDFASIGGAISNNSAGEKTIKYGSTRNYIDSLRVVLSNGDLIETHRLTKRELRLKKKQRDFEGQIYRKIDDIIEVNKALIEESRPKTSKNSAGYDIWDIKAKNGSFDLSQLICGSQGTLGIVTEATLRHEPYNKHTSLLVGYFDSLEKMTQATQAILKLAPSAMELVDNNVLEFVNSKNPSMLKGLLPERMPRVVMLVEFDDFKTRLQSKKTNQAKAILEQLTFEHRYTNVKHEQERLWKIRRRAAAYMWMSDEPKKSLPIIEDATVAIANMPNFLKEAYSLLDKYNVKGVMWGHAGNANFHIQPLLDLSNLRDRQKLYIIMDNFYRLVNKYHGSTCAEHNDGIIRAPYLKAMYGPKMYAIFKDIKDLFDPYGFLNPTSKIGATKEFAMVHIRKEYSMTHLFDRMPGLGHFH